MQEPKSTCDYTVEFIWLDDAGLKLVETQSMQLLDPVFRSVPSPSSILVWDEPEMYVPLSWVGQPGQW